MDQNLIFIFKHSNARCEPSSSHLESPSQTKLDKEDGIKKPCNGNLFNIFFKLKDIHILEKIS